MNQLERQRLARASLRLPDPEPSENYYRVRVSKSRAVKLRETYILLNSRSLVAWVFEWGELLRLVREASDTVLSILRQIEGEREHPRNTLSPMSELEP